MHVEENPQCGVFAPEKVYKVIYVKKQTHASALL